MKLKILNPYRGLFISMLLSAVTCYICLNSIRSQDKNILLDIVKTIISLQGTFLGFLLTLFAIVISLSQNKLIQNMIKSGHYANLLTSTQILSILFTICIINGIIILFNPSLIIFIGFIWLCITTMFYAILTIYKFFQTFKHISP